MTNLARACLAGIIVLLLALEACASVSNQPSPAPRSRTAPWPIIWAKDRPLTWDDFQGSVPPDRLKAGVTDRLDVNAGTSSSGHEAAETATAIPGATSHYSFQCTTPPSGPSTCKIIEFSADPVQAQFDPTTSWVISFDASDELLSHEQGHFDIAAIFANMLNVRLREDNGVRELSTSDTTAEMAEAELKAASDGRIQSLEREVMAAFSREQQRYDEETKHGTDHALQQQWLERIHARTAQIEP